MLNTDWSSALEFKGFVDVDRKYTGFYKRLRHSSIVAGTTFFQTKILNICYNFSLKLIVSTYFKYDSNKTWRQTALLPTVNLCGMTTEQYLRHHLQTPNINKPKTCPLGEKKNGIYGPPIRFTYKFWQVHQRKSTRYGLSLLIFVTTRSRRSIHLSEF